MRTACLLVGLLACSAQAQLTEAERQGIRDALFVGNLRESDLRFARRSHSSGIPLIGRSVATPIEAADELMGLHRSSATESAAAILAKVATDVFGEPVGAIQHDPPISGLDELPAELRGPILGLVNWINSANAAIRRATASLSPEERRAIVESLPTLAIGEWPRRLSFVRGEPLSVEEATALVARVDLTLIRSAAARLSEAVERAIEQLAASKVELPQTLKVRVGGMPVVIGGRGNDVHADTDALLTIDLGGDDTYRGRHGAGVGYASVLIDLGGNDRYEVGDANIGAGLLGIGLAYDEGGDDVFSGGSVSFGSGIAGVGVLRKRGGDDNYSGEGVSLGFGAFGVGLCLDSGGRDTYSVLIFGQGAARSDGVGWLVDLAGRDIYSAGGLIEAPAQFGGAHYSFSQAYSSSLGIRPGGIGLITDHDGDDVYVGEIGLQASAMEGSLASLFDAAGSDTYSSTHFSQGSAQQSSGAYFFDLSGNDGYLVKVGGSHALGHESSVGFLLDRSGDDVYASRESMPGQGSGNGLGLFVDADGTDRYDGPPGRGITARGTGSLGVFVDLNGEDRYRSGLADGQSWTTLSWGVAHDRPTRVEDVGSGPRPTVTPGTEQKPSDEELARVFASANGEGTSALDSRDQLVRIGAPALEWMLANALKTATEREVRTIAHVVRALGAEGARQVGAKAFAATDEEMRALLSIAVEADVADFAAIVPGLIKKPALREAAVVAAGALGARAAVPDLLSLTRDSDLLLARAAAVSLAQIGDLSSLGTAQALLFHQDLMVRKAALQLMAKFPEQAASVAEGHMAANDEFRARIGIELMAALGSQDGLAKIGAMLLDPRPGVRIECLLRLDGRCPAPFRADFLGLKNDPAESVKSVAARVSAGGVQ